MQVPIVIPKKEMKGLKMGPIGNNDWIGFPVTNEEKRMASDIACRCEKATEHACSLCGPGR